MQQIGMQRTSYGTQRGTTPPAARWRGMQRVGLPISLGAILLLWEVLVAIYQLPAYLLPAPSRIGQRFLAAAAEGSVWRHTGTTLIEAMGGFGLALMVGVTLGYLLATWPWLERMLAPHLAASQAVPIVAVAPLIVLWVGTGLWSRILVAALITFFPILVTTIVALRSVPRELREMALISGAGRWQLLWHVEVPLALPVLFSGIKAGLALATTGAVVGEFVAGRDGLGALINIARGLFDTPLMFVALVLLVVMTLGLYLAANVLERLLVKE